MSRRDLLAVALFGLTACSSVGGSTYFPPGFGGDLGTGPSGGDLGVGGARDLASGATQSDLSPGLPLPDLSVPPVDLARVDLRPAPDLRVVTPPAGCLPGDYSGPLSATATISTLSFNLVGTVTLTLGAGANGVLPILSGRMDGTDAATGAAAGADVSGSVDCIQGRLLNGSLDRGTATFSTLSLPFTGTIAADYDVQTQHFGNGTITTNGVTGTGTWSADLVP